MRDAIAGLDPVAATALSKAVSAAALAVARDGLCVGQHDVDVIVRVTGTLSVGVDTTRIPTCSVPLLATLALALTRAGIMRDRILALVVDAARDALLGGEAVEATMRDLGIDAAIATVREAFAAGLPPVPVRGAVKAHLQVTRVEA